MINQIRSLTEDTLSECQKRKSVLSAEGARTCRPTDDVGALTLTGAGGGSSIFTGCRGTSVEFARAAHVQSDGKRIRKRYRCAVSSARDFWAAFL